MSSTKKAPGRTLFGTDGIRGKVGEDLTSELTHAVGAAVAEGCRRGVLCDPFSSTGSRSAPSRPRIVIGRDTRPSGPALEQEFIDGASWAGANVMVGGVLPTAAVAYLTALLGFDAGVVISASHNPPADNGIKLFGAGGWKLTPDAESAIERLIGEGDPSAEPGAVEALPEGLETYLSHLTAATSHDLNGLRVAVDCANGAASVVAPEALRNLGTEVVVLNGGLDGSRINDGCGALHPEVVADAARSASAIGITFDGDADRVLLADENGRLVGGDAILALVATRMKREGTLTNDTVVVTVMANQALREWASAQNIMLVETPVGDRHVLEAMRQTGASLGGEQSGHIICLDRSTTGDGILVALEVLDLVAEARRSLAELVPFEPFPQVLVNVRASRSEGFEERDVVRRAVSDAEQRLGEHGRVLVRPSGTEPVVRVMVEAQDATLAGDVAEDVASAVRRELNGDG
jgi:phosphoglucosamine mutase